MFQLLKTEVKARRGVFTCPHGTVQTPVFMNVGTCGAIKGAVSAHDLKEIGCQIELSNTYHLHLRPGDDVVRQMGGLHKFMDWDGPMLTDSGGFQVFSLSGLRKITEEGVTFASHMDGKRIFMGPEESMRRLTTMSRPPASGQPDGWIAVQWSTESSMRRLAASIPAKCYLASTRVGPMQTCGNGTWMRSPNWTVTVTPSAVWL